jgi:hypothetical protein
MPVSCSALERILEVVPYPHGSPRDRAIRKRGTWYLTIAILIVGLDTIIKIQES